MKKSFMNNIKNFVDSNVRHRIDRATNNNNDFFDDDLLVVERQFEEIKHICVEAEKRISALLSSAQSQPVIAGYTQNVQASLNNLSSNLSASNQASAGLAPPSSETLPSFSSRLQQSKTNTIESSSNTTTAASNNPLVLLQPPTPTPTSTSGSNDATNNDSIRRHKKLPIVGFLKFLVRSCYRLKPDSLLGTTLTHCSQLQSQLTKLYLSYEQTIETECLRPIQHLLEYDAPNVIKLRKLFIKSHNDLESAKAKFNGASQKQQQSQTSHHFTSTSYTIQQTGIQQANINKLDQLKKELDEAMGRFEQARDNYATELYTFVCRETELVNLFIKFYQYQAEYQQQVGQVISSSLPSLSNTLALTPRKVVFGTPLNEHLRCTGRSVSLVIELSVHLLYLKALNEEGLFRIPGSSVKIKKLKSAINAWFVTLAGQNELAATATAAAAATIVNERGLSSDQVKTSGDGGQLALLAIHQLFKDIAGQRRPSGTTLFGTGSSNGGLSEQSSEAGNSNNNNKPTMRDDSTLTHQTSSSNKNPMANQQDDQHFVFDVHTIAGLLKLYLRELPEPLFTYALYQQWIDASVKAMNNKLQLDALERVIQQLPRTNYDNLRHLIRFLHLLTIHCKSNKMTSTNLAITMAPSLIWSGQDQQTTASQMSLNVSGKESSLLSQPPNIIASVGSEVQALNIQMSSVGISASLHALVIENLINHSETLFSGPIQFVIPDLENGSLSGQIATTRHHTFSNSANKRDSRTTKSNSPTGLSTASSSSFSSSSTNASITSSSNASKTHSRRGGSMEGLLGGIDNSKPAVIINNDNSSSTRPMSVYVPQIRQQQVAPPVPPAPAIRSHSRQAVAKELGSQQVTSTSPAPPPLPPTTYKRHVSRINPQTIGDSRLTQAVVVATAPIAPPKLPQPTSRRGTGRIDASSPTSSLPSATRPSVPPPNRPAPDTSGSIAASCENVLDQVMKLQPKRFEGHKLSVLDNNNENNDSKSYHSMASSGNLRAEFEEINALDVDDIDISVPSVSPVVSLDSITGEDDDSSFDNDCHSLNQSWTDMSDPASQLTQQDNNIAQTSQSEIEEQQQQLSASVAHSIKPAIRSIDRQKEEARKDATIKREEVKGAPSSSPTGQPPIKPPRCISPKITQSTPL